MISIQKVAVLGAGVMGSTIAAHLANAGLSVLLLDMVPKDGDDPNAISRGAVQNLKKLKPAPLYDPAYMQRIQIGNFRDDAIQLKNYDWVIEVIIENMDIKKKLFANTVIPNISDSCLLSTNTSGLSVNELAKDMEDSVARRFMVTHFFNPPRYMHLVELVANRRTDTELLSEMAAFITNRLGKGVVYAKDTPNFIANRIGVYSIYHAMHIMKEMGLSVEEADIALGEVTARPRSAAFRTADLVGLDTMVHVGKNSYDLLPKDEEREIYKIPDFLENMVKKGALGNKTGFGFYKKVKQDGKTVIHHLNYQTGEYEPNLKPKSPSVQMAKQHEDPSVRLKTFLAGQDKLAEFGWKNIRDTILYTLNRIPEISDTVVEIDNAMKWGFNWELGPFEMLDAIGIQTFIKRLEKDGIKVPEVLIPLKSVYKSENGKQEAFDFVHKQYHTVKRYPTEIVLRLQKEAGKTIMSNAGASLIDLNDGVYLVEFHSKMNTIGGEVIQMLMKSIEYTVKNGIGLVIGNQGKNFSVGANLMLILTAIAEGAFEDIDMMVRQFQKASMMIKYSPIPVVAAPHGLTFGGGCEFALHADALNPAAETYMGLVELGVGLIPAGGGTKELCIRAAKMAQKYEMDVTPLIFKFFRNIGMAKVSRSAEELRTLGYMREGDSITLNPRNLIYDAKQKVLAMGVNYRPSYPETNIPAPGRSIAASLKSSLWNLLQGRYISDYDKTLAEAVAHVITGGDVPAGTGITEQYLLDLEREAFLKLCMNKQTAERIQHMLKKGKPLRN